MHRVIAARTCLTVGVQALCSLYYLLRQSTSMLQDRSATLRTRRQDIDASVEVTSKSSQHQRINHDTGKDQLFQLSFYHCTEYLM